MEPDLKSRRVEFERRQTTFIRWQEAILECEQTAAQVPFVREGNGMTQNNFSREELISLVDSFRDPSSREIREFLAESLEHQLPNTDVLNLCKSDLPSTTIVDFCLAFEQTQRVLNRQELLNLVRAIRNPGYNTETEDMLLLATFEFNCRHPAGTDLIYYPRAVFGAGADLATDEMIVDKAMSGE